MGILEDFQEVVKGLRHKKFGEATTKCCPNCGSPRITVSSGFDTYPRLYGITPGRYVCVECGYSGPLVMEKKKEETV
jgi:predicted RNA-binding Zn-ribbon protein involved in translation (DUF1610 family)